MEITNNFCSYEISKLLKEKRFDEECFAYYYAIGGKEKEFIELTKNEYGSDIIKQLKT